MASSHGRLLTLLVFGAVLTWPGQRVTAQGAVAGMRTVTSRDSTQQIPIGDARQDPADDRLVSESGAVATSVAATFVPMLLAGITYVTSRETNESMGPGILAICGLVMGPALGYGQIGQTGQLGLRLGVASLVGLCAGSAGTSGSDEGVTAMGVLGGSVLFVLAVSDIERLTEAVRKHNDEVKNRVQITPVWTRASGFRLLATIRF